MADSIEIAGWQCARSECLAHNDQNVGIPTIITARGEGFVRQVSPAMSSTKAGVNNLMKL